MAPDLQEQELRDYAALSGVFDPGEALRAVQGGVPDPDRLVELSAHLARVCDTRQGAWLMRGVERRWALADVENRRGIADAVAWRRGLGAADGETGELLDALVGAGECAPAAVRGTVAAGGPRDALARLAVALDRAGPPAPAAGLLDDVRAALARLDADERRSTLLAGGVVGRDDELAAIAAWLRTPAVAPPVRALFLGGPAGLGKTTLLEEAVRRARSAPQRWLAVRLDFERAGLDAQDRTGLTVELARQLAAETGQETHALREARLAASGAPAAGPLRLKGRSRERLPVRLGQAIGEQVRSAGRPVLLVLDTLEALRARGETHPARIFDWLDVLVRLGLHPVAVLAAGRGDALDGAPQRIGGRIDLAGLPDAGADQVLAALDVAPETSAAVRTAAGGNPLLLRVAATVARETGAVTSPRHERSEAALLGRWARASLADERVRRLLLPGLVVRRFDAAVLAEVVGPHVGLGRVEAGRSAELFDQLAGQTWLVAPDPVAAGFLRYRPEVRRLLLRRVYETRPAQAAAIDRAAARWFARRPESWAAVEAAYHRLQLMRRDPAPPEIDRAVLRRVDARSLADLPPGAQDVVRRARGERSSLARGGPVPGGAPAAGTAAELGALVERGDWQEAGYVYERAVAGRELDPRSAVADAALAFLWRAGRWTAARRLLGERDRPRPDDGDLADLPAHLAAPRLEMRAELFFAAFVRALGRDERLARVVQDVAYCGLRSELSDGALGFAARRVGLSSRASAWHGADAVGAAAATWLAQGGVAPALAAAGERLARRLGPVSPDAPPGSARLLAVLTPYVDAAVTLGRVRGDPAPERHAAAADRRLVGLGGLPPAGVPPSAGPAQPVEPVDGLAALGLFAEWAGAAAFRLRDPDLRLIAQSAERWRRTAAGQWSYGAPPATWRAWSRPLDVTLADRLVALEAAGDPAAASREQLAAWTGDDRPDPTGRVARRLPGALLAAREAVPEGAAAVAAVLLRRRVPAAFVPALAVLLVHREL
ncbi:AAA family ATPase [Geodermatophilus sp. URMC 64]